MERPYSKDRKEIEGEEVMEGGAFYLVKGYKPDKFIDNPMVFFHVPKAGGTTVANILLMLFKSYIRIMGPLTRPTEKLKNNYEYRLDVNQKKYSHTYSALDEFHHIKSKIDVKSKKFIFGHFPYEITHDLTDINHRIKMTVLRDPIKRCQSHINFYIGKGFIKPPFDLANLFEDGIISSDLMTRQFSGDYNVPKMEDYHVQSAIKNIKTLDYVFEVSQIQHLLNMIISIFNFPNILYQNLNVTEERYQDIKKYELTEDDKEIIQEYNQYDIEFFNQLKKEKLFFSSSDTNTSRKHNETLVISNNPPAVDLMDENKLTLFLDKIKQTGNSVFTI